MFLEGAFIHRIEPPNRILVDAITSPRSVPLTVDAWMNTSDDEQYDVDSCRSIVTDFDMTLSTSLSTVERATSPIAVHSCDPGEPTSVSLSLRDAMMDTNDIDFPSVKDVSDACMQVDLIVPSSSHSVGVETEKTVCEDRADSPIAVIAWIDAQVDTDEAGRWLIWSEKRYFLFPSFLLFGRLERRETKSITFLFFFS